jgi:ribosomal protein L11 methyltransferase
MPWLALTLELDAQVAEPFSDALLEAGADSVLLDASATARQRLTALLGAAVAPQTVLARAARACGIPTPDFTTATLDDCDWVRRSQAQFVPLALDRLWIGPSWIAPPVDARAVLRIDPGLAFGTGSHPSTRLVLRFLEDTLRGGESVLDYGCGSGILALAAAKLGAGRVDAVDSDPQAVQTCSENAAANGVALRASLPEALPPWSYDIVVANILADPLMILAPVFTTRTRPGGWLALAGILDHQAKELSAAYADAFRLRTLATDEGWSLLGGTRQ